MVIGPSFLLTGFEPSDVRAAPDDERRDFWTAVSGFVVEAKADDILAGLDKDGNLISSYAPLRPKTIKYRKSAMGPADPGAPPLIPAHDLSRTRSLFSAEPTAAADGVDCYWAFDSVTGDSWGEILDYHRQGAGALPVRDVFGLSPASLGIVKQRASDWWRGYVAAGTIIPPPLPGTTPWGRITPLPGTGPRSKVQERRIRLRIRGQHYDLQGGLGLGAPPGPQPVPVYKNKTPKPPPLPTITDIRLRGKPPGPAPIPTPEPVPTPIPIPIPLPVFARSVMAAARAVPDAIKYSESKVWIIDVFDSFASRGGLLSIEEFKAELVEAHRAGLVTLSRFDLPGQLSKADRIKDAESMTTSGVAEWNQIRI